MKNLFLFFAIASVVLSTNAQLKTESNTSVIVNKELEADLHELMSKANSRAYPALARQYRETIREIAELQGDEQDDIVSQLIANG